MVYRDIYKTRMNDDLELNLKYVWFHKNIHTLNRTDIVSYIEYVHDILGPSMLSSVLQTCKYKNADAFVTFFLALYRFYPEEALLEMEQFSWYDYIDIISELLVERENDILCKKLIQVVIEQLYEERYGNRTSTALSKSLPRERKSIDRRTHITKVLAYNYYQLYMTRNALNEWDDIICADGFKKSDALKLYRKDCVYLSSKNIMCQKEKND